MNRRELFKAVTAGLVVWPLIKPKSRSVPMDDPDYELVQREYRYCEGGEIKTEKLWMIVAKKVQ